MARKRLAKTETLPLSLYRLASKLARPAVPFALSWRERRGREDPRRLRERMGLPGLVRPEGRLVWLHAAGNGDGQTLLTLVDRLVSRGFHVLLTTRTIDSASTMKRTLPAGAFHQFLPLDVPAYVNRFLDHWRPDMVLIAGAEIWPNLLIEADRRDAPIIFVNARMSDRVYGYCRRIEPAIGMLLSKIDLCLARTELDAERYAALGAKSVQTVGDLALDQPLPPADPVAVNAFTARIGSRPVWVAALIDPDEIALVIDVHRRLLPRYPDLITIVVPRLPRDGEAVAQAAAQQNLERGLRSWTSAPARLPGIFIVDVSGDLGLFYRVGDIAYIGRTMSVGGCSPIEAAKLGCAILHGPRVDGFNEIYKALDTAHGGVTVTDAPALVRVLALLFDDGAKLRLMQRNASHTMDRLCGGTSRVMRAIEPHVLQMMVDR